MKDLYGISVLLCLETIGASAFCPAQGSSRLEMVAVGVGVWLVLFSVMLATHGVSIAVCWLHSLMDGLATTDRMHH